MKPIAIFTAIGVIIALWYLSDDHWDSNSNQPAPSSVTVTKRPSNLYSTATAVEPVVVGKTGCADYLKPFDDTNHWQQQAKIQLTQLFDNFSTLGVDETTMDWAARKSGIGVVNGRELRNMANASALPSEADHDAHIMTKQSQQRFLRHLARADFTALLDDYQQGRIEKSGYFSSRYGNLSAIGHLIYALKNNLEEVLPAFIDANVMVNRHDVLIATELGVAKSILLKLITASNIAPETIFHSHQRHRSYTTAAVLKGRPELVDFWLSMGSPATPDPVQENALDLLARQSGNSANETQQAIFEHLMRHNVGPSHDKTVEQLNRALPKALFAAYKKRLSVTMRSIPSTAHQRQIDELVITIHQQLLKTHLATLGSDVPQNPCFTATGNSLARLATAQTPAATGTKDIDYRPAKQRLAAVKAEYGDPHTIIAVLGETGDIDDKYAIALFRSEQSFIQRRKDKTRQNNGGEENSKPSDQAQLDKLLQSRLNGNPKVEQITELLERGAHFAQDAILTLIRRKNSELAEQLLDYDLELNYLSMSGHNALYYAVSYRDPKMLAFLLRHNVPLRTSGYGLDALDQALAQFTGSEIEMQLVTILLDNGAVIALSHQQKTRTLQREDPIAHQILVSTHPQLSVGSE